MLSENKAALLVLVLGLLSGYPVGAAAARRLYEEGGCNREQAGRLVALCNNSGPAFVVGVVGAALWGSAKTGWLLYLCHVAGALVSGMVMAVGAPLPGRRCRREVRELPTLGAALIPAVRNSALTCLYIAAFIVFFGVVTALLPVGQGPVGVLASGLLEMTGGVTRARALALAPQQRLALQSFLIGTAGLSVLCQVGGVLEGSGIPLGPYVSGKLLSGAVSLLLTLTVAPLFPQYTAVSLPAVPEISFPAYAALTLLTVGSFSLSALVVLGFSIWAERGRNRRLRGS